MTQYSFVKGLGKGVTSFLVFAIPVLLDVFPAEWMNLTIGGGLVMLLNYLKIKVRIATA